MPINKLARHTSGTIFANARQDFNKNKREMNIRTIFKTCIVVPAAMAALASCNTEQTEYFNAYLTAVETEGQPYKCYFISDDSLTVIPLNYYSNIESLKTDDRLIATFTIPSGEVTDPVEVEFTSFVKMVPQDILQTSAPDTVGNDPADPQVMWQSGGIEGTSRFLTINFIYQASTSGIQHKIYLIDDLTAENPDEDGYYHLKFRHDANKDQFQLSASSVATFPLPEKYTAPGIKGIKVDFNTISEEKDSTLTVNFK